MYYRLVDAWGEPYATGYNDTNLKELAYSIFSLGYGDCMRDDEEFYGKTDEDVVNKIYDLLLKGERELAYFVEEQETPFSEDEDPGNYF